MINYQLNLTNIKHTICTILAFLTMYSGKAQTNSLPAKVEVALQQAGKNNLELEKAINHFRQTGDSLKLQAAYFLITNISIHTSVSYYWADSLNSQIAFNELSYPTFES